MAARQLPVIYYANQISAETQRGIITAAARILQGPQAPSPTHTPDPPPVSPTSLALSTPPQPSSPTDVSPVEAPEEPPPPQPPKPKACQLTFEAVLLILQAFAKGFPVDLAELSSANTKALSHSVSKVASSVRELAVIVRHCGTATRSEPRTASSSTWSTVVGCTTSA